PMLSYCLGLRRDLHSVPTRRSSDLQKRAEDAAYAALRKQVYRRDVGCCRVCGAAVKLVTDNPLLLAHLHHVTFRSAGGADTTDRSEEHTSELQSREKLVCRLLLGTK